MDRWDLCTICLKCAWGVIFTHLVSHAHCVAGGSSLCHTTLHPTTLKSYVNMRSMSYLYPQHLPPTACSTDCSTSVLSDDFDFKAWDVALERDLSSEARIDLDSDSRARKMYASLVGPRAESVFVLKPDLTPPHPAQPTSLAPLSDPTRSS